MKELIKRYWTVIPSLLIVFVLVFLITNYISPSSGCGYEYCVEGILTGYKDNFHYNLGNDTHYCSEGFPNDFESYFGKNVRICGLSGCGRASIWSIEILN